ncbi:NACHT domain-containing protein [Gilvimarinus sp. SDUM040013]|uniref:NACHT domain-containing protein n=1 Tax=Gilvimarinus gilvus TaxID=3058038 RepID=A0ABU4S748_9GAMM|nr:NACHT domain-containing protein [Gilvimarinus sp. SDUM040013]MDO3387520.1 NACHT domain-containing protein [Gilvimarinus sp. SDUM040013]MDX6851484.1 NACHT domain-containing protein [Gilvimarinus sp. SDUM040013]
MNMGEFAADFLASNVEIIFDLAKKSYTKLDEKLKLELKTAYCQYLKKTGEKYSKSKSFFIRNESVDLYSYYVPAGISIGDCVISKPDFKACSEKSKRIIISGTGGSGKSILLRHLFLSCIQQKEYVPILVELRDLNSNDSTLNDLIADKLDSFGFNQSKEFVNQAKIEGHFCLFLDGFDEVNHSIRKRLIKQIAKLSTKYDKCPIFISSRPDEAFNGIDDFSFFHMMPLTKASAIDLVERLPFDEEIKSKFSKSLLKGLFEKHESFLSNPLLLSIMLLTYGENAEIPNKISIFYNQAYEALFQRHDANKGGYYRTRSTDLDIQDFSKVFSFFSLQTYEKRLFKMPRSQCLEFLEKSKEITGIEFKCEDYLRDLLSAACLMLEDGLDISYSHRSFQEYFVARAILISSPEVQKSLLERYWINMRSDSVIDLLTEMNPDLIERVLIVPKLKYFFDSLGVKNKIGITHGSKYIKKIYKRLNVGPDRNGTYLSFFG